MRIGRQRDGQADSHDEANRRIIASLWERAKKYQIGMSSNDTKRAFRLKKLTHK
jgi:hypothetical protein